MRRLAASTWLSHLVGRQSPLRAQAELSSIIRVASNAIFKQFSKILQILYSKYIILRSVGIILSMLLSARQTTKQKVEKAFNRHHSQKKVPPEYLQYRQKPKEFSHHITSHIKEKKKKNQNPLYSTQSLAKYFYLPTTDLSLTMNYLKSTQNIKNAETLQQNKQIAAFNTLQEKMRKYQERGSENLKKKFQIFTKAHNKIFDHYDKVKDATMLKDPETLPWTNLSIQNDLTKAEKKLKRNKFKTGSMERKIRNQQIYSNHMRNYIAKDEEWQRYGYTLDNQDDEKLIQQSLERKNKFLREKSKKCNVKYQPPKLKECNVDKDIITYSRFYMNKRSKTVG